MKVEQVSFAAGEISPVLHARADLAKYHTALAELVNMIVLPQGGVTRRAGFSYVGKTLRDKNVLFTSRLIPFEYNSTDSELLEFGHKEIRVWQRTSEGYAEACTIASPYEYNDVKGLRYVQSGNVMFLVHRRHKPQMLRRNSLTSWSIEELPYHSGPWISGEEWASGAKLSLDGSPRRRVIFSDKEIFKSGLAGSLMKVEYAVSAKSLELTSKQTPAQAVSDAFEVKGTLNVTTSGNWVGLIMVDRSADGGSTWITVRQYKRTNPETQGQWDFTISETEENILYRVTAQHTVTTTQSGSTPSSQGSSDSSGDVSSSDTGSTGYKYPEHPDVPNGENYIYRERWATGNDMVKGTTYDGREFYYSASVHQTFYIVGRTDSTPGNYYTSQYGYVVDGYPVGYDEDGNYVGAPE